MALTTQVPARVSLVQAVAGFAGLVLQSFRAQWYFFVVPVLFLLFNEVVLFGVHRPVQASASALVMSIFTLTLPAALFALFIARLIQFACVIKPESPIRALIGDVKRLATSPARLANGLPVLVAMILFNKAVLELKPAIPLVKPFSWDVTFMELDRMLHFGVDPWRLLQPLLGHDAITFAFNLVYNFWFLALFGLWFWFGFKPDTSLLRLRFFISYMIGWFMGGGVLALYFSSAGPCYYSLIGLSPDPFQPLMAYLYDVNTRLPIWALDAQQLLWDGYTGKFQPVGISAFPSMHNTMATIFALVGWRMHKSLGIIFTAYAGLILVGSVHLGWHYAVDGYAGIVIALAAWWVAAPLARWAHGLAATQAWDAKLAEERPLVS
ncbi:MAG: phosphatase PAP2 family protein [Parvibaculaceae bacterium]